MNWKWKLAQAMEIRWWRSYLSGKLPVEYLRDKRAYWRRVLQEGQVEIPAEAVILDAGSGPAGIFTVLAQHQVDAVDPLLSAYAIQLPHFDPQAYPSVNFITGRLEEFRPGKQYDLIFCLNAINHVSDIGLALDRLRNCLKADGTLWLSVDAHRHAALQLLFRAIPADILHPHQYTLRGYEQLLTERDMKIIRRCKLKPGLIFDYYLLGVKLDIGA